MSLAVRASVDATSWYTSDDPAFLLRRVHGDRKSRLYSIACCWEMPGDADDRFLTYMREVEDVADRERRSPNNVYAKLKKARDLLTEVGSGWLWAASSYDPREAVTRTESVFDTQKPDAARRCQLIRSIWDNPYTRTKWSNCDHCKGWGYKTKYDHDNAESSVRNPCRFCGPSLQIRQLAHAAYYERERKCGRCKGAGGRWGRGDYDQVWKECSKCRGTGVAMDGELDPLRFAVLADALEESGAPEAVYAHLRLPGDWYRGHWSLDLVLGKQS